MPSITGVVSKVLVGIAASRSTPMSLRTRLYRMAGYDVARSARFEQGLRLLPGSIRVGEGAFLNVGCVLEPGPSGIVVEDRAFLGAHTVITATTREIGPPEQRAGDVVMAPVVVGAGCLVGTNTTILPGVSVGAGCVIGAGSVLTKSTEPHGVYVGAPARRVRDLSEQPERPGPSTPA